MSDSEKPDEEIQRAAQHMYTWITVKGLRRHTEGGPPRKKPEGGVQTEAMNELRTSFPDFTREDRLRVIDRLEQMARAAATGQGGSC